MDPSGWLDSDEGRLWAAYLRSTHLVERAVDQRLRTNAGLTHAEFEILFRLAVAPGQRLRMGALATTLIVPKGRLNYQIGQLVERGLVERRPAREDKRGLHAALTQAGLQQLMAAVPGLIGFVQHHVTGLLDSCEQAQLTVMLDRITASLPGAPPGSPDDP